MQETASHLRTRAVNHRQLHHRAHARKGALRHVHRRAAGNRSVRRQHHAVAAPTAVLAPDLRPACWQRCHLRQRLILQPARNIPRQPPQVLAGTGGFPNGLARQQIHHRRLAGVACIRHGHAQSRGGLRQCLCVRVKPAPSCWQASSVVLVDENDIANGILFNADGTLSAFHPTSRAASSGCSA